jgi:hypothetical protein
MHESSWRLRQWLKIEDIEACETADIITCAQADQGTGGTRGLLFKEEFRYDLDECQGTAKPDWD